MKTGLTLSQMASELERQQNAKRDFISDTRNIALTTEMDEVILGGNAASRFGINEYAHGQFAELLKVPVTFYKRLRENHPDLLAHTVNELLQREPTRRMVRTLDGKVRAVMSDRYRRLDNYDLGQAVLPVLMEHEGLQVVSTQFTESKFYIKAIYPKIQGEVKKGDVVRAGVSISNSEVGAGSVKAEPFIDRLVCDNGMILAEYSQRRYHVGKKAGGDSEAAYELFSDRTKELDDAALWAKVQDTVRGVLKQEVFDNIVKRLRDSTEQKLEGSIEETVELTAKRFGYNEETKSGILQHLIKGADLTRWGLANAITRQSQDEEDYDRATQLEADGGNVIEMPSKDWEALIAKPIRRAA